MEAPDAGGVG